MKPRAAYRDTAAKYATRKRVAAGSSGVPLVTTMITVAMSPPSVAARTRSGTPAKSASNRSMRYGSDMTRMSTMAVAAALAGIRRTWRTGPSRTANASAPKKSAVSTAVRVRRRYALTATSAKMATNRTLSMP